MFNDEIPIRIGISSCLLGEKVRFDAGHKKDLYLTNILGKYVEWIPVCPEVEVGMGVPREAIRLVGKANNPNLVGTKSGRDWTDEMKKFSQMRNKQLAEMNLSGFIFKKDSPTCGMERVRVYSQSGSPSKEGIGIFARSFIEQFPLIPVEEEGRLNDIKIRENFIERVFAYNRLLNLFSRKFSRGELVRFHTYEKLQLLSHSEKHYRELGNIVAKAKFYGTSELRERYSKIFMEALKIKTTTKKNANVLFHILGYLKNILDKFEKDAIVKIINDYQNELVPLIVPLTLIRHYIEKHNIEYIKFQTYLNPHPKELMLRNHV
ncbi:MAG: Hypothetical protein YbgA [Ignavibacteriae bacterium]|nr:MAG: Hypothetical protein YbgA [Ignavibacteriota bacterium]